MGGSGAASLGPLRSLAPFSLVRELLRSLALQALTCFFPHPHPPTFRQVLSSSLGGTCGAGPARLTWQVDLSTQRRWEWSLELLLLEEEVGLRVG